MGVMTVNGGRISQMKRRSTGSKCLRHRAWREAVVALGGNVGHVPQTFLRALHALQGHGVQVLAVSSLYMSLPLRLPVRNGVAAPADSVGVNDLYTNAACRLRTTLGPKELLVRLQKIECDLGRQRRSFWGPRTLDLDLITYDALRMLHKRLLLPHPGIPFRAFVLAPLRDINVQQPWPLSPLTVNDLLPGDLGEAWGIVDKQLSWSVE